jgi:hypothetical protein
MAVVNQYKFVGIDNDTSNGELNPFSSGNPLVSETYVIKSILVTSAGTPSPIVTNNSITAIKSVALTANVTKELLTQPLIVEGGKTLTIKAGSADSFDIAVSYLNIKKEVTT